MNSDSINSSAVAIIAAAGQGLRVGVGYNKIFLPLNGQTVLETTLNLFLSHPRITHTYLVISPQDRPQVHSMFEDLLHQECSALSLVDGGARRQDSVLNALNLIQKKSSPAKYVLVHDAARPLCTPAVIDRVLDACCSHDAVIPTVPIVDTIRHNTAHGSKVIDRSQLSATQTPQGFRTQLLWESAQKAVTADWVVTDDASLIENAGFSVSQVSGDPNNFKITTPEDHNRACGLIQQKAP